MEASYLLQKVFLANPEVQELEIKLTRADTTTSPGIHMGQMQS